MKKEIIKIIRGYYYAEDNYLDYESAANEIASLIKEELIAYDIWLHEQSVEQYLKSQQ